MMVSLAVLAVAAGAAEPAGVVVSFVPELLPQAVKAIVKATTEAKIGIFLFMKNKPPSVGILDD
ncbi:hypothetical protein D3C85_839140 [compost metagenome]